MVRKPIFPVVALFLLGGCASGEVKPADGWTGDLGPDLRRTVDLAPRVDLGQSDRAALDLPLAPDLTPAADLPPTPDLTPSTDLPVPDLVPPPDAAPVLTAPFTLDFEQSSGGLTGTKDWEWGAKIAFQPGSNCDSSHVPPTAGHSGSGMWGTKLNDCYSPLDNATSLCANQDTQDDSILTLTFQIPSTFKTASLVYWEWADYFLGYDWSEVYVNGGVVRQHCTGSVNLAWVKRVTNLDALVGQKVTVRFHFMATSIVQYAGWYIDDISVSESLPP